MKKQLVINADDFGMTEPISRGILHAINQGIVNSVSVVTNTPALSKSIDLIKAKSIDIGIHLTLNSGKPTTKSTNIPIVSDKGYFYLTPTATPMFYLLRDSKYRSWIKNEFRNQIEMLLRKRITITHLDSHFHIHAFPAIFPVIVDLVKEYAIPFTRAPLEPSILKKIVHPLHGLISLLASIMKRHLPNQTLRFYGLTDAGRISMETLPVILRQVQAGNGELMVHPGYAGQENAPYYGSSTDHLQRELDAVTHLKTKKILSDYNIKLMTRSQLVMQMERA